MRSTLEEHGDLTELLRQWEDGDARAFDRLMSLVYSELKSMAVAEFQREASTHTLQPTALVHEVYLRLKQHREPDWENRAAFFGAAANVMRRVLIDQSRKRKAAKRGSTYIRVELQEADAAGESFTADAEALDEALTELSVLDERAARIVHLRFFAGLTVQETAAVLNASPTTVKRDFSFARAWLRSRLEERS